MAEYCINKRPNGSECGRKVKPGSQYCRYHHKLNNGMVKSGKTANMAKLLGLSGDEAISYDEFLAQHKPHELHNELYQLRALLVSYRKAYAAMNEELKDAFIHKVEEFTTSYLVQETGMIPEKAEHIAGLLLAPVGDAYDDLLTSLAISEDYVKTVSTLIKDIGWLAEKAVKIKDGMTFNLVTNSQDFVDFVQDVVFAVVKTAQERAELARLTQIWLGRTANSKTVVTDAPEADYELREEENEDV